MDIGPNITAQGNVEVQGECTLNGVAWPTGTGSTGQALVLTSSTATSWQTIAGGGGGGDPTPDRDTVTDIDAYTITVPSSGQQLVLLLNDATGGTLSLPSASAAGDGLYSIADISGALGPTATVVLECDGADTINGSSTFTISGAYHSVTLVAGTDTWSLL